MTLKYQDPIPEAGVDHIEYALQRNNVNVKSLKITDEAAVGRITIRKVVDANMYLTYKSPVDPYAEAPEVEDDSFYKEIPRIHKRFSIQEILDAFFVGGMQVGSLDAEGVLAALEEVGITTTEEELGIKILGHAVEITALDTTSFKWWGKGVKALVLKEVLEVAL